MTMTLFLLVLGPLVSVPADLLHRLLESRWPVWNCHLDSLLLTPPAVSTTTAIFGGLCDKIQLFHSSFIPSLTGLSLHLVIHVRLAEASNRHNQTSERHQRATDTKTCSHAITRVISTNQASLGGTITDSCCVGVGGTCVIRGCLPKKILVYASQFRDAFEDAVGFGWASVQPPHDWKKLISKKAVEVLRQHNRFKQMLKAAGVHLYEGRGRLVDPHTVEVQLAEGGTKYISAKYILIATGSAATKLSVEGAEHAITSDEALHLDKLPDNNRTLLIMGSG